MHGITETIFRAVEAVRDTFALTWDSFVDALGARGALLIFAAGVVVLVVMLVLR